MNYRRLGDMDVSEIALDAEVSSSLGAADFESIVSECLENGVNLFLARKPEEVSSLGEALKQLDARKKAVVCVGIEDFFKAFASHDMHLGEFLEHELADRLERLAGNYIDCLVIDLGRGHSMDLETVRSEGISAGDGGKAVALEMFEGGTFLHETISDCLTTIEGFVKDGRVRLAGVAGENIDALTRVLVKHPDFDAVFAPFNYGFSRAAAELIPVAAETQTPLVATRPLWWGIREIPVTVLAESPYPPDRASVGIKALPLQKAALKWPLTEKGVVSVSACVPAPGVVEHFTRPSGDEVWTRADEETLRKVASIAKSYEGLYVALSAMNSVREELRALGWALLQRRGLAVDIQFDFDAPEDTRSRRLAEITAVVMPDEPAEPDDDIDQLI